MRLPDFEAWAIFAVVAAEGSYTNAARVLGLSKATISKAVSRLEDALGTVLFHRTSRRLSLSAAGAALLPNAQALLADGEAAAEAARSERTMLAGRVRLAAPMSFGIRHLGPVLADFLATYPGIEIDLHLSDARVDLVGRFDLALRIAALDDSTLRVIRLRAVERLLVAAPSYLARQGHTWPPRDLAGHRCFLYSNLPNPEVWHMTGPDGERVTVRPQVAMLANNSDVLLPALIAGQGIAQMPDFLCDGERACGQLVPILPEWAGEPITMNLLMPPSAFRPARVEALIAFLRERLA